jgi:parvulin-like peptidyl-prolyl isomerase
MRNAWFWAAGLLAVSAIAAAAGEVAVVEEIIAKVNGDVVTRGDLERARRALAEELERRNLKGAELEKALQEREKDLLRDKIDTLLLIQKGNQLNINVDQDVSKYLAEIMLQYKVADQDKFAELVRQQTGMRFEDFRQDIKNGMLTQRVLSREVGSRIAIPREEIQKYYEEHKNEFMREERVFLREILVAADPKDPESFAAAEKKAKALVERARRGERFDELARENSDAVTAKNGGDLGGWKRGDLKKEIEDLIWDKERNYVTDPIRTENGYLILKVMAHHQAGLALLEEVENEIMGRLYGPRFEPKVREYLTELRQQAYLEIKDGWVDTAAAPGKDTSWTDPARLTPETVTKEEVLKNPGRKRLLWVIPVPGTQRAPKSTSR